MSTPGSITTPALADGSVTASKIAPGAVSGSKISLQIVTTDASVTAASSTTATASCPTGTRAFGGGVTIDDSSTLAILTEARQSQPIADAAGAPVAWRATVVALAGAPTTAFHVYATCG